MTYLIYRRYELLRLYSVSDRSIKVYGVKVEGHKQIKTEEL